MVDFDFEEMSLKEETIMTSRETNLCNGIIHSASAAAAVIGGGLAQVPTSDNTVSFENENGVQITNF